MRVPVAQLIRGLGGRATWQQLLARTTSHQVRQAVLRGEILRVADGIYVVPELAGDRLAAIAARGALCLGSAALAWELPVLSPPTLIQVAVPPGSRPPVAPAVRYRFTPLTAEEVHDGRTSLVRTVLECATVLPFPEALVIADAALHKRRFEPGELLAAAEQLAGRGRPQRLRVARAADAGAESPLESLLRAALLEARISRFRTQLPVRLGDRIVRVDLGDPVRKIALEADGFEFHGATQDDFDRDLHRYNDLVAAGWAVLRFNWRQVRQHPDRVVDRVRSVLANRAA